MRRPNMLHMVVLRSPYAHARIKSIDLSGALSNNKVVSILTGEDLKNYECYWFSQPEGMKRAVCYPLAVGKVRHVGEPVAALVAEDRSSAKDALEQVAIEYEPLPAVVAAEDGLKEEAPLVYEEWGDNVALHYEIRGGDVDKAFKEADYVFSETLSIHRYSATPIEPRSYFAEFDKFENHLTLWATTQNPHLLRTIISVTLKHPESRIRVIEPDVGGAFGGKMPSYPEEFLVCIFAKKLGRPIKYVEERSESLVAMHQAREQKHKLQVAVLRDGTIVGIKDSIIGNLGVSFPTTGPASLVTAARFIPSCYRIQGYYAEVIGVATNKPSYGAYRGFGKDAANFIIERLVNLVARRLKLDPVRIRIKNFVTPSEFPYRSVTGALYDSGNYADCLRKAAELIEYEKFRKEQSELRKLGKFLGIGFSAVLEPSASHFPGSLMMGYETATVRLEPTGSLTVLSGMTSTGTSHETVLAQIASEILKVKYEDISVIEGDTEIVPYGFGNWASRSVVLGANAVYLASKKLEEKIIMIASFLLGTSSKELELQEGFVVQRANSWKKISLSEVAHASYFMHPLIPPTITPGLEATATFFPQTIESKPNRGGKRNAYAAYGYSVNTAIVSVDVQTGAVSIMKYVVVADAGRILNPQVVEGQIVGGVCQGLGGVLFEEHAYNNEGQPMATSFMDYLLPTARESPEITVEHSETPSPFVPLGAKGAGEGGAEGVAATIVNAVEDALDPFNATVLDLPLKPETIWRLVQASKLKTEVKR